MTAGRLLGGRYQVGELLGYGGMAEVHRGRDLRLGRDVAIKMLRTDLARDETFQIRFRREAQNAASLNHPAIVAVYDTGEEKAPTGETIPYIVMEFVNGHTFKEVLTAEGRLMPRRALEVTADICAALEFSHRHGIIHRDIKPGNVMLTQTGQVKVMDFGIARALASGATTMTQTSAVIGTAQYLSPEQARGEPVDARSDVYATGCVLYELLTGHPPFVGDNPVSVAYQHVREDPRPPSDSNRDVTPDIDAVVLKALAKNRMNRYQSAAEMRSDLLRAAAGRPVLATPVMREVETAPLPPQPPRLVGNRNTGTMARVGNTQRRRTSTWVLVALSILGMLAVIALGVGLYLAGRPQESPVPSLIGMTQPEAQAKLAEVKLNGNGKVVPNSGCTKDKVFEQDPKAGEQLQQGKTVNYSVCGGPGTTSVPKLLGLDELNAKTALTNVGLTPKVETTDGLVSLKDKVVRSDPAESSAVAKGSVVTVYLSKGNQNKVPDVKGMDEATAKATLASAGFTNVRTAINTDPPPGLAGKAILTTPGANTVANLTDQVSIQIGANTPPTTPPPTKSPSPNPSGG
ncbi:MAG: serine/threonine protein kinase [Actinobacteria bacterium 13_2_20CM_2_71_6]|nr:MAG: serine/threonine protein kinase [Actinobacteria bacterium 13_2_20CM_2_71_6]